jgi:hypothetical protein
MRTLERNFSTLRYQINAATTALAINMMVSEDAVDALVWFLQNTAKETYTKLQRQNLCDSALIDADNEGLPVRPILLPPNMKCARANPLMFTLPFTVAPLDENKLSIQEAGEYLASMTAVAIYNIGLSRHVQAYETRGEEQKILLKKARDMYLQSLNGIDQLLSLNPSGSLIMVYLALCNNLAEVYDKLKDPENAFEWQQTLQQSLLAVPFSKSSLVYRHFLNAGDCYSMDLMDCYTNVSN